MAVTPTPTSCPQADPPKGVLRIWKVPICAGAVVAFGAVAMVIWTGVTLYDIVRVVSFALAGCLLAFLSARGLHKLREKGLGLWRVSVCAGAAVGIGVAALVIWTGVTLSHVTNVLVAAGIVSALYLLVILLARGLLKLRDSD